MKLTILFVALVSLAACVQTSQGLPKPAYNMTTEFKHDDFKWSKAEGKGTITGQAFLRTRGGEVKTCAGSEVILVPDNAYTRESRTAALSGNYSSVRWDPNYYDYRRKSICDAQGRFTFRSLPAGKWGVATAVVWEAPSGQGLLPQGGSLAQYVSLAEGQTAEIVLTERDR